jgi:hypothetical protein
MTGVDDRRETRGWPAYLFGGRLRTSTAVLLLAFALIGWMHATYGPAPEPAPQIPAVNVVPPGFIPDPAYTWAPRTDVQPHTTTPTTTTPTTTTSGATTTPTTAGDEPPEPGAPETTPPAPSGSPATSAAPAPTGAPAPEASPSPTTPPPATTGASPAPAAPAR